MLELLNSLSLESGALIAAALCILICAATSAFDAAWLRYTGAMLISVAVAYLLYWTPYYLGAPDDQFSTWAPLVISVWFVAAAVASVIATYCFGRFLYGHRRKHN